MAAKRSEIKADEPQKTGRPTTYTKELAERICEKISANPFGLMKLHRENDWFPACETIYVWQYRHTEFAEMYARAKQNQAAILAEDILDIADDSCGDYTVDKSGKRTYNSENSNRSRLRIDARKWVACKLLPKVYGDKISVETKKSDEDEKVQAELLAIRTKLDEKNKKDI